MKLRLAAADDAAALAALYAPWVTGSAVSFETEPPDAVAFRARVEAGGGLYPWLVACEDTAILGYASASPFRSRPAYRFTVETSVYLAREATGRGIGGALYRALLGVLERQGFAQAIAAITLPNPASVALHERIGFAPAGIYRDVGWKLGRWHSVGLWQRELTAAGDAPTAPKPVAQVWTD